MADNHSSSLETALSNDSSSPTGEPKKHYDQQASVQLDFEVGSQFYTLQIDHVFQTHSVHASVNAVQVSVNGRREWRKSRRLILKARAKAVALQLSPPTQRVRTNKPTGKKADRVVKRKKRSGGHK